jgi:spermidine synthase
VNVFLVGLVSLLAQVVLLRELSVAFYGIELAYLFALAAWLAGTAAGALTGNSIGTNFTSARFVPIEFSLAALALPLDVAFIRRSRLLLGGVPGAYLPIERQVLVLLLAVIPMAALFGLAFRSAAGAQLARGGRLAKAYAVECAGAAVAGLAATLAFRAGVQTFAVAVVVAGLGLATLAGRVVGGTRHLGLASAALAVGVFAAWHSVTLDERMTRWNHPTLTETRDTPYARITLATTGSQVAVFENDVLTYDSESSANEELPHLAALQHPHPSRVLLLGGAAERIDRELARHNPRELRHVEMDGPMVSALRRALPATAAPRIADPRAALLEGGEYDLIIVATGEPVSGQSNRFYTREFFDACARRLAHGGVLGVRLQVPPNYLGVTALLRAASVARALAGAFRFVEFLPGSQTIALASDAPLPAADVVAARLAARGLETRLVTPAYINYLYTNDRREELRAAFTATRAPENRDGQPIAYLYATTTWLSKFWPALIGSDPSRAADVRHWPVSWRSAALVLAVALLALAFLVRRVSPRGRGAMLAFAAGWSGMVLETVVLLHYQATHGALFEDIGVLMMAFMAGSVVGASWRARLRPGLRAALLLTALSAWAAQSRWLVLSGTGLGVVSAAILLAGIGATVAGLFACASERLAEQDDAGIGVIYAADVFGGCLGAIAASLALVPLTGLGATALVVAAIAPLLLIVA